jgi:uncharacterized protein
LLCVSKEATGGLDDQVLRELEERLNYLRNLDKRREEILKSIESQEKITPEITNNAEKALTLAELEDIYRPFKPKRRTRASIAKEKGLEPFADFIIANPKLSEETLRQEAENYINEQVVDVETAIAGASDIIAENISDNPIVRTKLHTFYTRTGIAVTSAVDSEKDSVYRNFYDSKESVTRMPPHRIMAVDRGEREGFLKVNVDVEELQALGIIADEIKSDFAVSDSYKRLIAPSLERRIRTELTEKAVANAVKIFGANLKQLLLQPPIKNKVTLGFDPGNRTGCKIAVVSETGKVLDTTVVYPTPPYF